MRRAGRNLDRRRVGNFGEDGPMLLADRDGDRRVRLIRFVAQKVTLGHCPGSVDAVAVWRSALLELLRGWAGIGHGELDASGPSGEGHEREERALRCRVLHLEGLPERLAVEAEVHAQDAALEAGAHLQNPAGVELGTKVLALEACAIAEVAAEEQTLAPEAGVKGGFGAQADPHALAVEHLDAPGLVRAVRPQAGPPLPERIEARGLRGRFPHGDLAALGAHALARVQQPAAAAASGRRHLAP
mmetsp:Transcript_11953/g.30457  ORF Transcript_11953/g.30457 Transcript_11953/m.30457 type:complete len:244 (-) Transcript_11953:101-832(-)